MSHGSLTFSEMKGTTTRTIDVRISVPRELWLDWKETKDAMELRLNYDKDSCGGNVPGEEYILRNFIIPGMAQEVGLNPDNGELHIRETGHVEVDRPRSEDGTFTSN